MEKTYRYYFHSEDSRIIFIAHNKKEAWDKLKEVVTNYKEWLLSYRLDDIDF